MAKIPGGFSVVATEIQSAINEGRTEDAKTRLVEILLSGTADKHVQRIAARLIKPKKLGRGQPKSDPQHWFDIGVAFHRLRDSGINPEGARAALQSKWGYSETHIRNAVKFFDVAKSAHDEATAE